MFDKLIHGIVSFLLLIFIYRIIFFRLFQLTLERTNFRIALTYLHESMKLDADLSKYIGEEWVYELEIKHINATDIPPRLTLEGALKTRSIFSFLTGDVRLPFRISSVNTRIEEGGF